MMSFINSFFISGVELLIVYFLLLYLFLTRFVPKCLAWIIQYKYQCVVTIGKIGLPYLALHNVTLRKNDSLIMVGRVGFTSSLLNSDAPKLLSVIITTVDIVRLPNPQQPPRSPSEEAVRDPRKKLRAPTIVSNLVQFLGIHIADLHLWGWEAVDDKKGVHANFRAKNVSVDGCTTVGANVYACVVLNLGKVEARVSENWLPTSDDLNGHLQSSYFDGRTGLTLIESCFDFRLSVMFGPRNSDEFIEHFSVDVEKLLVSWDLKEKSIGLFNCLWANRKKSSVSSTPNFLKNVEELVLTQCVPKEIKFRIYETECRIAETSGDYNFESKLSGFSFTSKCVVREVSGVDSVFFESQFDLGLIRIEPDSHQSYAIDQLSNYINYSYNALNVDLDITNLTFRFDEKNLQFVKAKLTSNSTTKSPINYESRRSLTGIFKSLRFQFESTDLDVQWNDRSTTLSSAYIELECKDLKKFKEKDTCSLEVIMKKLSTCLKWDEANVHRPITFELLGVHFQRDSLGSKLSGCRLQWIPSLEAEVLHFINFLVPSEKTDKKKGKDDEKSILSSLKSVNLEIFDSKLMYTAENELCFNADLEAFYMTSDLPNYVLVFEGFEVFSSSNFSDCTLNPLFMIPKCEFVKIKDENNTTFSLDFDLDTVLYWSPLLHMQTMQFNNKIRKFKDMFSSKPGTPTKSDNNTVSFHFSKSLTIVGKLAKNHAVEIVADCWHVERGPEMFDWTTKCIRVRFDGIPVMRWDEFILYKGKYDYDLTKSFRKAAGLSQKKNTAWYAEIVKLSFTFPYGYNFAAAFNEEFVNCFKWVKKLRSTTTQSSPKIWSDIRMKIQAVRIEFGDDPFEVKLRDNYELLEDEYYESLKRYQVLDTKINQLYKTNLLMSSSRIEELRSQLKEKNSTIYIQRSKKLYENHPMRTHLLLWEMGEVHVLALSDTSLFGKDTITSIMQELDPDSPWPPEGLDFSTLWCRSVRFDVAKWRVQLRDFPQPLMDSKNIHFWGKLVGAEVAGTKRSKRTCEIQIGGPFDSDYVERNLNVLKWYYDLNCDIEYWSVAFGPCWEPVLAQCNLAFENVFPPSRDPSKPLPFWDKIRLNLHGRLYMAVNTLTHLLHASLNPYNTTEEMEVTWTEAAVAWTNGKIIFEGDLNVYVRTASKYDDCRMLHLPNIRLTFKLNWLCLGDANDHHAVTPCAPDKLPEYSSNQEHDSYRAFRSENLNMSLSLETRSSKFASQSWPTAVLYGSTLRWFENLKFILSGTTRPTKRGAAFSNIRPKKIPISRHYKKIRLSVTLNRFHVCYWVSFSMQSGVELHSGKLCSSSEHLLTLQPINDGLIHRPKAEWSVMYVNSELNDTEIWLQSSIQQETTNEMNLRKPIEKFFFMSIDKLSYGREALLGVTSGEGLENKKENPQHRLVVHELKGAWTSSNRDVAFALLESFVKVQQLKKNLSTEALRSFFSKHDAPSGSPIKSKPNSNDNKKPRMGEVTSPTASASRPSIGVSSQGHNAAASLLQKLISEAESRGVVFSEDLTSPPPQQSLHGVAQSSLDDVILHKWLIELVNCQVLLKGCETPGYVILSAANAHILQREHKPVWKHGTIVPKTTWVGALEGMQYYATVCAGSVDSEEENIQWLSVENIEERHTTTISTVPDMVGSGQSVGGVVSETVGASSDEQEVHVQLQRIVSRCKCEFFYTTYGETGVDKIPSGIPDIPPAPKDLELWDEISKPVEAFTLTHDGLNIFTNSSQYAMVMDIISNLVLYVDPKRKEAFEKLQRLRFKLQLQSTEAQRGPIQQLQNHLRNLVNQLRRLEKEAYIITKQLQEDPKNEDLNVKMQMLDQQVNECKEQIAAKGEELHMMIMCYKESKLAASQRLSRTRDNKDVYLVRIYEICFKHAQWRLTQNDGQLGIADLVLSNFLYTKTAKSDDSTEHLCELGYITVTNLLPNQLYKKVLVPSHIHASMPVDRRRTLRVFCRDRPPVGGIAVKEHFEINIAPITIGMTYQFYKTLFKFCFPEKDPEKLDEVEMNPPGETDSLTSGDRLGSTSTLDSTSTTSSSSLSGLSTKEKTKRKGTRRKESKFYVAMSEKDDVEKMKERAEKNMLFICVKVPELPVIVSYKGEKEKNIEDVQDVHVLIPTLEYNNITWTWLDFLLAVRNHSKRVLLSQAIKQKLWKRNPSDATSGPPEEDKAKMLLGANVGDTKGIMKSLFGPNKK